MSILNTELLYLPQSLLEHDSATLWVVVLIPSLVVLHTDQHFSDVQPKACFWFGC